MKELVLVIEMSLFYMQLISLVLMNQPSILRQNKAN